MIFDPAAPPREPIVWGATSLSNIANGVVRGIVKTLYDAQVRGLHDPLGVTKRFDFVHLNSRVGLVAHVVLCDEGSGRRIRVEYSCGVVEPVAGLVAIRLQAYLGVPVVVGGPPPGQYAMECVVPRAVAIGVDGLPTVPPAPRPLLNPALLADIEAERHFRVVVGGLVREYCALPRDFGYRTKQGRAWEDGVYGDVTLETHIARSGLSREEGDTSDIGELTVSLKDGSGRDLLEQMVDLPPYLRAHGLMYINGPDANSQWRFLFKNEHAAA